jgi:hypothetical protein
MNEKNKHAVALGKIGGSKTSKQKARAARQNGKAGGDPRKKSKCLVPGCRRLSLVRGLCGKHYVSWKYWADPKIVAARNRKWRKSATRPRAKCHPSRAHQAKGNVHELLFKMAMAESNNKQSEEATQRIKTKVDKKQFRSSAQRLATPRLIKIRA